jgi:hypothetical protein
MDYITNINFSNWFIGLYNLIPSKKKTYSQEDMTTTIEKLNNIQSNINTRIGSISTNIDEFLLKSKKYYKEGNKKSAVYNLKLKKMYEREKEKLESINFNIESQIFSIESMGLIIETAETLKDTSTHLKNINNKLDIEKIESTMEELHEHRDINEELQNIFSESISMEFDEDELLKELEGDDDASGCAITVDKNIINNMPIAPTTKLDNKEINKEINKDKKTIETDIIEPIAS